MPESSIPDRLLKQFEQISSLPPNDLHNRSLTSWYKLVTRPLKSIPLLFIIPLSVVASSLLYFIVGPLVIYLASFLQHGF